MSACLFSIIIPSFNYAQYLPRAIQSVLAQPGNDFEIIIIDDGSTDNTADIIAPFLTSSKLIKYIYQSNKGSAAARNIGIKQSLASYLIFLDADDELLPDALHHYRESILEYPDKYILIGGHKTVDDKGRERVNIPQKLKATTREDYFSAYLFKKLSISAGAYAMHHTVFNSLCFPEQLRSTEDIPLYCHALALFDVALVQEPLAKIHKHDDSLRHNFSYADDIGTKMVDVLFDPNILPDSFMAYRKSYYVKRCLSLSGLAYRAGAYSRSRKWFMTAVRTDKRALLKSSRLKKFLFSFFKKESL